MTTTSPELTALAHRALHHMLHQTVVTVIHEQGYARNGWPLPIKRALPAEDGTTTQNYRPLAVLEYVQEVLSGDQAKRKANDRKAEQSSTEMLELD